MVAPPAPPWSSRQSLSVLATGWSLPGEPVTTALLRAKIASQLNIDIPERADRRARSLGIGTRYVCRDFAAYREKARTGDANPQLAARAARMALDAAQLTVNDIGCMIGHTTTPAGALPANITLVADILGYGGPHFELRQACTGFAAALMIADGLLRVPDAKPLLIVGSETGSLYFDPTDATANDSQLLNFIQMGDGAGAIILAPGHHSQAMATMTSMFYGAQGLGRAPGIALHHGGAEHLMDADNPVFIHDFKAVREHGLELIDAGWATASSLNVKLSGADLLLPHQVNGRLDELLAPRYALDAAQIICDARHVGNTGSAAIWLGLARTCTVGLAAGQQILALGAEASKFMFGGFLYVQH